MAQCVWVRHGIVRFDSGDGMPEETRHSWIVSYVGWLNFSEARAGNGAPG
jgi:hypothetical protein